MIQIIQLNIQSLNKNLNSLNYYINNHNIDICILSETFELNNPKLINFKILGKSRQDNYGGVAIGFKNNIKFRKHKFDTEYDIIIAETTNLKINFILVSAYFPPNISASNFENISSKLFSYLENLPNVILCGDFNARTQSYGDVITQAKGSILESIVLSSNFLILNDGSPTYHQFADNRQSSVLDLTFTNSNQKFDWKTENVNISGSHHIPIIITINKCSTPNQTLFTDKIKLSDNLKTMAILPDFDDIYSSIHEEIKNCTRKISSRTPKSWWDDSLKPFF